MKTLNQKLKNKKSQELKTQDFFCSPFIAKRYSDTVYRRKFLNIENLSRNDININRNQILYRIDRKELTCQH